MTDAVQDTLSALIRDYGGRERFDSTQLLIAAKLSELLCGSDPISAQAVVALSGLLPAKRAAGEPELDLTKLSDKEFQQLDYLTAIAAGLKPSKPGKQRRAPRYSHRQVSALLQAIDVDQIEAEFENAFRNGVPFALTDFDRATIHNACYVMMELFARPEDIWPHIAQDAEYAERKRWLDREAADASNGAVAAADRVAPAGGPVADPANVVRPPIATWGVISGPRQHVGDPPGWSRPT